MLDLKINTIIRIPQHIIIRISFRRNHVNAKKLTKRSGEATLLAINIHIYI